MSVVVALIEANNEAHYKVAIVEKPQVRNIFGDTLELVVTEFKETKSYSKFNLFVVERTGTQRSMSRM